MSFFGTKDALYVGDWVVVYYNEQGEVEAIYVIIDMHYYAGDSTTWTYPIP